MKKLRHNNGYFRGCYRDLDKTWQLGETLTLKEVLDEWWNNVTVRDEKNGKVYNCWKEAYTCNGTYELDGQKKSILNKQVLVNDYYDEDSEGNLIVTVKIL